MERDKTRGRRKNKKGASTSSKEAAGNNSAEIDGSRSTRQEVEQNTSGAVGNDDLTFTLIVEPYVQSTSCKKLKCAVGKCMDCQLGVVEKDEDECRFNCFRKLRYSERHALTVAGFRDHRDYSSEDLKLWTPDEMPKGLSVDVAKYLLEQVGDHFCQLVKQEKEALLFLEQQLNQQLVWRKAIPNMRELCDVCLTSLFNYHWTCGKCGFAVCVSCIKTRSSNNIALAQSNSGVTNNESKDAFGWLMCHLKNEHKIEELMLTQIVPGKALDDLWTKSHDVRKILNIPMGCCDSVSKDIVPGCSKQSNSEERRTNIVVQTNGTTQKNYHASDQPNEEEAQAEQIVDDAIEDSGQLKMTDVASSFDVRDEPNSEPCASSSKVPASDSVGKADAISDVAFCQRKENKEMELKNFIRRKGSQPYSVKTLKKKSGIVANTWALYPKVKHWWVCNGYLLRLLEPANPRNLRLFQEQWKRGQPVIVSNVSSMLNKELWVPESFSRDFGSKSNDLVNCITGKVVPGLEMKRFWDGFENVKSRLKDDNGLPMLLKLKDWPPGHDFAEVLPERFRDLMKALPLGKYTHRDGPLNLAARLPSLFSKPDLGPKMYIAYGSALHLDKGTTNLHLDVSDAVNVMVYVGVVKDEDNTEQDLAVMKAIEDSGCDEPTIYRVQKLKELPGAIWHIWEAKDADKIRDLFSKIALEKGETVEPYHDAIHDQSWYVDRDLRQRLLVEYNVRGYSILQCEGDAVFIPAGAPHQVRNLNNCIKVAEDFVSPETVGHCFNLTEEFRNLTEAHTNHEDKLQIKNIVYHTVKDAVAVIEAAVPDWDKWSSGLAAPS